MFKRETSDGQVAQRSHVVAGRLALDRGDWARAVASFKAAAAEVETAEAVEGLAEAAWWLGDVPGALRARERSYHLYRRCDDAAAARLAMLLAVDHFALRAEQPVAAGWFQRARRLIETLPAAPEHGWLAAWEAHVALEGRRSDVAQSRSVEALAVGRARGVLDLEMLAMAQQGLLRVREGDLSAGMDLLDEASAAATSGELTDRRVAATTHSYLIDACVGVGDLERVAQWHHNLVGDAGCWARQAILSRCRLDYVPVLLWRGEWAAAEEHLEPLLRQADEQPAPAGRAAISLAFIRRRQGRRDEAAALLERASSMPTLVPAGVTLGRAELAIDTGDADTAGDAAERLVGTLDGVDLWQRARALEILLRAQLGLGESEAARWSTAQLRMLSEMGGTEAICAYASMAEGLVAAAAGNLAAARRSLEDAVHRFTNSGAASEAARVRLELAGALEDLGRPQSAAREAAEALAVLAALGAADADQAQALLDRVRHHPGTGNGSASGVLTALSPRELEVLRLLADGRSNRDMAQELFLSVRTVERHVSTIYRSLGVSGRTARAAAVRAARNAGLSAAPGPQSGGVPVRATRRSAEDRVRRPA